MTIKSFPPKAPKAHVVLSFDFSPALVNGEILTNLVAVDVTVNDGKDDNPDGILSPSATPGIQGNFVVVPVIETKAGYKIGVTVDTSDPNKRMSVAALLPLLAE
jgi:hypothetical protein